MSLNFSPKLTREYRFDTNRYTTVESSKTATLERYLKLKHVPINISVIKSKVCAQFCAGNEIIFSRTNLRSLYDNIVQVLGQFTWYNNLLANFVFDTVRVCVCCALSWRGNEKESYAKIYARICLTGHSPERREATNRDRFY